MSRVKDPQAALNEVLDLFRDFVGKYEEHNPKWYNVALLELTKGSVSALKNYLEDPKAWKNPSVEVQYPVEVDENKARLFFPYISVSEKDSISPSLVADLFSGGLVRATHTLVLGFITGDAGYIKEKDNYSLVLPQDLIDYLEEIPKKKREKIVTGLEEGFPFDLPSLDGTVTDRKTGRTRKVKGVLSLNFNPLVIDRDTKKAYFPVYVDLSVKGCPPERWSDKDREDLWRVVFDFLEKATPEIEVDFLEDFFPKEPLPEPEVLPSPQRFPLVKAGLHAERQKFGTSEQLSLFEDLDRKISKEAEHFKIGAVGVNLSEAQLQALFTVQKMLTETNYKGNVKGRERHGDGDDPFKFSGIIPAIKFTEAEYLEAYGVKKHLTKREKHEYSGKARKLALDALYSLGTTPFLIVYKRFYWTEDGKKVDRIQAVSPLITILWGWPGLTEEEDRLLDRGIPTKPGIIAIEPCPLLIDQIESYFVLKPANYQEDIKRLCPKGAKYPYLFIDYLINQAELKRRNKDELVIRENYRGLADKLHMDSYIKTRNWKRIRETLKRCYEIARALGWLSDYKINVQGTTKRYDELILNPEKFPHARKTRKEKEEARVN